MVGIHLFLHLNEYNYHHLNNALVEKVYVNQFPIIEI